MSATVPAQEAPAVAFHQVAFAFDEHVILRDVSFTIPKGNMRILLGASGAGKSVLLKLIMGLLRPDSGEILINGRRIDNLSELELLRVRGEIGMLFQESALFDSLTVGENVGYRMYEESDLPLDEVRARVQQVLEHVGLGVHADRMPSELSGGQRRRVAMARAVAANPSLLLLDDPTVGLDPVIATAIDQEIVKLRDVGGATSIAVTHQIRDAVYWANHEAVGTLKDAQIVPASEEKAAQVAFMVLHEGRIYFEGAADALLSSDDPYLRKFLFMTLPPW